MPTLKTTKSRPARISPFGTSKGIDGLHSDSRVHWTLNDIIDLLRGRRRRWGLGKIICSLKEQGYLVIPFHNGASICFLVVYHSTTK